MKWLLLLFGLIFLLPSVYAVSDVGYEYLDGGSTLHVWNLVDDYYFNASTGQQFTNHYQEYWTHNTFCGGRYSGSEWLDFCSDTHPFSWVVSTDNSSYVSYEGTYSFSYAGKNIESQVKYYLGVDDEDLTIFVSFNNTGKKDVPEQLRFGWKVNDIRIDYVYENNSYYINETWYFANNLTNPAYDINDSETLVFTELVDATFWARRDSTQEYLYLKWDNETTNHIYLFNDSGEFNAPVALYVYSDSALLSGEVFSTEFHWKDALDTSLEHNEQTGDPVTVSYTAGADAGLLVFSIMTKTSTTRTGGAPTYNGTELTEVFNLGDTGGEGTAELWYMIDPPTGSSLTASVPNSGSDEVNLVISSYDVTSGKTFWLQNYSSDSGVAANPSVSVTSPASGSVVADAMFSGYRNVAGGNTQTLLYKRDTGGEGYGTQYAITTDTSSYTMGWTQNSDDYQIIAGMWQEIELPTVELNTTNETVFDTQTPTLNFTGTDGDGDDIHYNIQIDNSSDFNSSSGDTVTYYFDASDAGPTDPAVRWSNDANAFDGSLSTYSQSSVGTSTVSSGYLQGDGTNAPTSSESIFNVQARIYGGANSNTVDATIYTDGLAESLGTASSQTSYSGYGDTITLSTPSGGWTWQKINDLEVKIHGGSSSFSSRAYIVEVLVTIPGPSIDVVSLSDSGFANQDTPADTTPFNSGDLINYTIQEVESIVDSYAFDEATNPTTLQSGNTQLGNTFTATQDDVYSVEVELSKTGSPDAELVVDIYAIIGTAGVNAEPTGSSLGQSEIIEATSLGTSSDVTYQFNFTTPISLTSETDYFWVVSPKTTTTLDASNYVRMYLDTSPTFDGNMASTTDGGSSWTNATTVFPFEVKTLKSPLNDGQYYWRVRGNDTGTGSYGEWSETRTFNITLESDGPPTWTNNLVVNDTAVDVGDVLNFNATGTDPESDNYYLTVCDTDAISDAYPGTCTGNTVCTSTETSSASEASCTNTTNANQAPTLNAYGFLCDEGSSTCSASTTTATTITGVDSCTYGGSGDWDVQLSDDCVLSTVVDVGANSVNLIGDAGSFTIDSSGDLTCRDFHLTPDDFDGDAVFTVLSSGTFSVEG